MKSAALFLSVLTLAQGTPRESIAIPGEVTTLSRETKTVLMADVADGAKALAMSYAELRPQRYDMCNWHLAAQILTWEISVPADGH